MGSNINRRRRITASARFIAGSMGFRRNDKRRRVSRRPPGSSERESPRRELTLAGLETRVHLIDDVNAALAAYDAAIAIAGLQGLKRIGDLHDRISSGSDSVRRRNILSADTCVNRRGQPGR